MAGSCQQRLDDIGCILPFATASVLGVTSSQTLIDGGDGWFFLGIAIIAIILGLLGKIQEC